MDCGLVMEVAGGFWKVEYIDEVTSTNTLLTQRNEAQHGSVIIAGRQTAGRGRLGRQFESSKDGGLYMSALIRPDNIDSRITLAVGLAAAFTLEELCSVDIMLKWPNDIICRNRKIGGILTESRIDSSIRIIAGIGINLSQQLEDFPQELWNKAGSVSMCGGQPAQKEIIAGTLLKNLEKYLALLSSCPEKIIDGCRSRLYGMGREVTFGNDEKKGTICGLDDNGCLLIDSDGEVIHIGSGEIQVKGLY